MENKTIYRTPSCKVITICPQYLIATSPNQTGDWTGSQGSEMEGEE